MYDSTPVPSNELSFFPHLVSQENMKNSQFFFYYYFFVKDLSIQVEKAGYEHSGQSEDSVGRLPSLGHQLLRY